MTTKPIPLITIGITSYNSDDSIQRAVESALSQTWTSTEILVIDDFSSDNSWNFLEILAKKNSSIHLIRMNENRGVGAARQLIVETARGEFIAFFDDDDVSIPQRLELQYQRILNYEKAHNDAVVLCYSNRDVVEEDGRLNKIQRLGIGRIPPEPNGQIVADFVLGLLKDDHYHYWGMLGSCTLMAKTSTFRKYGGFDARFRRCAELDFAVNAALNGAHFVSVDAPLIVQYLTATPDKFGNQELNYRLLLLKKYKTYLGLRRAYIGAIARLHGWWHLERGNRFRGRSWQVFALLAFPIDVSWNRIKSVLHTPHT